MVNIAHHYQNQYCAKVKKKKHQLPEKSYP